ncbi:MAG: hypothetical protein ACXAD7_12945 [Candidatus Kariarchaeaceae archaeon]
MHQAIKREFQEPTYHSSIDRIMYKDNNIMYFSVDDIGYTILSRNTTIGSYLERYNLNNDLIWKKQIHRNVSYDLEFVSENDKLIVLCYTLIEDQLNNKSEVDILDFISKNDGDLVNRITKLREYSIFSSPYLDLDTEGLFHENLFFLPDVRYFWNNNSDSYPAFLQLIIFVYDFHQSDSIPINFSITVNVSRYLDEGIFSGITKSQVQLSFNSYGEENLVRTMNFSIDLSNHEINYQGELLQNTNIMLRLRNNRQLNISQQWIDKIKVQDSSFEEDFYLETRNKRGNIYCYQVVTLNQIMLGGVIENYQSNEGKRAILYILNLYSTTTDIYELYSHKSDIEPTAIRYITELTSNEFLFILDGNIFFEIYILSSIYPNNFQSISLTYPTMPYLILTVLSSIPTYYLYRRIKFKSKVIDDYPFHSDSNNF